MRLENNIYNLINRKKSVFLVGKSNSGKTYFIKNELIPFLKEKEMVVSYFSDGDQITSLPQKGIAVIDEVETFQDKEFLEKNNTTKKPYHTKKYAKKVNSWFKKLKKVKIPTIYIITRNNKNEIEHFQKIIKTTDWDNRKVKVVVFTRLINNIKV